MSKELHRYEIERQRDEALARNERVAAHVIELHAELLAKDFALAERDTLLDELLAWDRPDKFIDRPELAWLAKKRAEWRPIIDKIAALRGKP